MGQGGNTPQSKVFDAHSVVLFDGKLYDPSYGKQFDDLRALEKASFAFMGAVTPNKKTLGMVEINAEHRVVQFKGEGG